MKPILSLVYLLLLPKAGIAQEPDSSIQQSIIDTAMPEEVSINQTILMADYFTFIDSIVKNHIKADSSLSEYTLVHANPWILDSLRNTDYYLAKEKGKHIADTRKIGIFHPGDRVRIPARYRCLQIKNKLDSIWLDINVPEFRLRVKRKDSTLYTIPIRVGQNTMKYLETAKRVVSLQTDLGEGRIIKADKDPYFVNPVDGKHFTTTKRDDGYITEMPMIPWLETEIGGVRNGDMIHPTTNLNTLNKAYSNGCIGLRESDAWLVYYYAPPGTRVIIRYDLNITNEQGENIVLKDVYRLKTNR